MLYVSVSDGETIDRALKKYKRKLMYLELFTKKKNTEIIFNKSPISDKYITFVIYRNVQ